MTKRESGNDELFTFVFPAKAGNQAVGVDSWAPWIPACAGMTRGGGGDDEKGDAGMTKEWEAGCPWFFLFGLGCI